jgi:outer membrane protein assembly factor BamB
VARPRRRSGRTRPALVAVVLLTATLAGPVAAAPATTGAFTDTAGSVHEAAITALAQVGVTSGCGDGRYCPGGDVRRDQLASFLARALRLPPAEHVFEDVDPNSVHSPAVGALAAAGVTSGCDVGRYCPGASITRGQLATMLTAALDLPPGPDPGFVDVTTAHHHHPGIWALAASGITQGCRPDAFCPNAPLRRDQMASLLVRALGLDRPVPCPVRTAPSELGHQGRVAAPGYPTTAGAWIDDRFVVFPNDLGPTARLTVLRDGVVVDTEPQREGRRVWATAVASGRLWYGVGAAPGVRNVFPVGGPTEGFAVPSGGALWDLTADASGRLYAATRAFVDDDLLRAGDPLADPERRHVVHRLDPATGAVDALVYELPVSDVPFVRTDAKQVAWHAGDLYVGFGTATDGGRLVRLPDVDGADGSGVGRAEEVTPAGLVGARAVFALEVTDAWIALGTQAGGDDDARLLVLRTDDPTGTPVVDRTLPGDSRVDQVVVDGATIVAAGFPSGRVYRADARTGGLTVVGQPVRDTATRALRVHAERIEGLAAAGRSWDLPLGGGQASVVDLVGVPGVPVGSGSVHSLGVTPDHVLVGASNEVFAHGIGAGGVRSAAIGGEVKAVAARGATAFLAVYPGGELWQWTPADDARPRAVADWDDRYGRPRDLAVSPAGDLIVAVAQEDAPEPPLASAVIVMDVRRSAPLVAEHPVTAIPTGEPIEATAVEVTAGQVIVGDSAGGLRALDPRTGVPAWERAPVAGAAVVSLEAEGGAVVAVDRDGRWSELDPLTGELLRTGEPLRFTAVTAGVTLGPVTIGKRRTDVVAFDRATGGATRLIAHAEGATFTPPHVVADHGCVLHFVADRDLVSFAYDARSRLEDE